MVCGMKQNTIALFRLWESWGRSVKTRGGTRERGRARNRERCPNWRVPREYFYRHQLHFSSPAVGDFSHYLNPEGKRKRSQWEEERYKGEVEPLFWWISYLRYLSISSALRHEALHFPFRLWIDPATTIVIVRFSRWISETIKIYFDRVEVAIIWSFNLAKQIENYWKLSRENAKHACNVNKF